MNKYKRLTIICACCALSPNILLAEEKVTPLFIDNLFLKENNKKINFNLHFSSNSKDTFYVYDEYGEKSSGDYLSYSIGYRYGLSEKIETSIKVGGNYQKKRSIYNGELFDSTSSNGNEKLNIGISYKVKNETDTPAIIVSYNTDVVEKNNIQEKNYTSNFKNHSFSILGYITSDPLIFSSNLSYNLHKNKKYDDLTINEGNNLSLSLKSTFIVNPYANLGIGVTINHLKQTKVNNSEVNQTDNSIILDFSADYEVSRKNVVSIGADIDTENNSSTLMLSYVHTL